MEKHVLNEAAAPAQGQQSPNYWRDLAVANRKVADNALAELSALKAQQAEDSDTVRRICDLFGIGSKARTQAAIMANVENTHKFARMLDAIEAEFFMVPGEIDPEYPDDQPYDCLVNRWASTPEQYVEQFRAALETLKAQQVGQEPVYLYRRKGIDSWATCDEERYEELAAHSLFEVKVCYDTPQPAPAQDVAGLVEALKFYANGDHLLLADPDVWDTCSGEPVNFLHDDAGTASVEDGSIAKAALAAHDKQSGGAE